MSAPWGITFAPSAFIATLLLGACAPSAEEIRREFDALLSDARACNEASDCTLISPGCPLGCIVAVRVDRADELQRRAEELIEDYERGGQRCAYDCLGASAATCTQNECEVVPLE